MAARPSIVFLFDLDLPSVQSGSSLVNGDDDFPVQCIRLLRHIVLNILNYFSEKQVNIQWGYRFYSSLNYQLTNKARFVDLSVQTVEEFEENLNVQYEQSNAVGDGTCLNQLSAAGVLGRTLQDIISDYDWKTPSESLTPTRKGRKIGKQLEQNSQNLVFIFTEVPSDEALLSFCKFSSQDEVSVKALTDAILPKELAKRFQEFQMSLNFIDLTHNKKHLFSKFASSLRGTVISAQSLTSPFSFNQILQASCISDISLEEHHSCLLLPLNSKVVILVIEGQPFELQMQCWNQSCSSRSSLCLEDTQVNTPVIKCLSAQKTRVPSINWLKSDSLCLLYSQSDVISRIVFQQKTWVGKLDHRYCCILPLTSHTAVMVFPETECSFNICASTLFGCENQINLKAESVSSTKNFVERLFKEENETLSYSDDFTVTNNLQNSTWSFLSHVKGDYVEKKGTHLGLHWQILKNCFRKKDTQDICLKESNNNSFDPLAHSVPLTDISPTVLLSVSNDGGPKKIGSNRIQNLRASTLLQKSQEVRARNSEMEREKIYKEKQVAEERKEKMWREVNTYLLTLRSSIGWEDRMIRVVPNPTEFLKESILEGCLNMKTQISSAQLEDWQIVCIVQVIASTVLYMWKDASSVEKGFDILCQHFLKQPGVVNRSTPKDAKVYEFKFQIILRLELSWVIPSLIGDEESVLQDATSLFQMLSIHSSPQVIASFFQDSLVTSYENMLPEFLVNLGEELNQPIPASLADQVRLGNPTRTPSPALSSKPLSVQSVASQQDGIDSHRSGARDLRPRTLSRQPSLNVLQHKKQIAMPNKVEKSVAGKKEESTDVVRVRRSLQFGSETPVQKSKAKSPAKGTVTPRRLNTSFEALPEFTTPSKPSADQVLAPETPSRLRSDGKHKKTDGVNIVGESPEVKQEALRRSPRRMEAAFALRRRASFYSSLSSDLNAEKGASRNWSRAESQVWSEKAKASASIQAIGEDSSQTGQSARFLFSKILSRNDSMPISEPLFSPRKNVFESENMQVLPSLATPRKMDSTNMLLPPSTPSRQRLVVPESSAAKMVQETPHKTPMKTPKHVQFDFSFQPATPSSKTVPDPRSILKSPMAFQSPRQNWTPRKMDTQDRIGLHVVHVLDDTNFKGRHQLELHSPVKTEEAIKETEQSESDKFVADSTRSTNDASLGHDNELVHKLDEETLRADDEVEIQSPIKNSKLAKVSPLVLRRSPRYPFDLHNNQPTTNFYQHNPNWSVVNYRRPNASGAQTRQNSSCPTNNAVSEDPYAFEDEMETKPKRNSLVDSSSHKRKLFQSLEKTPTSKRRRVIPNPSPIDESKTPPCKFSVPKDGSLFHLENSPLLSSMGTKFIA